MSNLRPTSRMSSYSGIRPPSALGSHRQSTASHTGYSSHAPSYGASSSSTAARQYDEHGNVLLTPGQARAFDKQAEYEGFLRVLAQSEQLAKYCAELEDSADLMADGGQAIARVVENWQNVFRATHITLASMAARQARGEPDPEVPVLIRIPNGTSGGTQEGDKSVE